MSNATTLFVEIAVILLLFGIISALMLALPTPITVGLMVLGGALMFSLALFGRFEGGSGPTPPPTQPQRGR
ncbi:MAG: hypothetical protein HC915_10725 [Anaerolineae bacterium]|nr:hypothetical protein [Anaerolineae bacterium]